MWKDFTWNHMWNLTCEKTSHEITCDISHVKGVHMKSHVKFNMWKTSHELYVTFHMWKDFTWNYKGNFTCEMISGEITCDISHVKYFTWSKKWNFTCERISHKVTSEISCDLKDFTWNFTSYKNFIWTYRSEISYVKTRNVKGFHMFMCERWFHMKLQITRWCYIKWNFTC